MAARGAQCAAKQGAFASYHGYLFEESWESLNDDWHGALVTVARKVDVGDLVRFERCIIEGVTVPQLAADLSLGRQIRVEGTPTYMINRDVYLGVLDSIQLRRIVEKQMQSGVQ